MGKDDRGEDEERENLMVELGERGNRNRGDTVAGKDANADGQDRSRANTNNEKTEIAPRREGTVVGTRRKRERRKERQYGNFRYASNKRKIWVQGVGLSRHRTHTHLELLVRDLDAHLACHDLILMREEPAGREREKQ